MLDSSEYNDWDSTAGRPTGQFAGCSVGTYLDRRLREILSGEDQSPEFAHLSQSDRTAIQEILAETLP